MSVAKTARMPGQSLLEGVAPVPPATDRLFFAIYPDPPAAACIAQLARQLRGELGLTGRPPGANRFHVTLYCLGDFLGVPDAVVAAAGQVAPTLAAPPFEIASTVRRALSASHSTGRSSCSAATASSR